MSAGAEVKLELETAMDATTSPPPEESSSTPTSEKNEESTVDDGKTRTEPALSGSNSSPEPSSLSESSLSSPMEEPTTPTPAKRVSKLPQIMLPSRPGGQQPPKTTRPPPSPIPQKTSKLPSIVLPTGPLGSAGSNRDILGNRKKELEELKAKGLTKNKREKYAESTAPLTTPEQAATYLQQMRSDHVKRDAPTNLSSSELDSWVLQSKAYENDRKRRKKEAEAILRGYVATLQKVKTPVGASSTPPSISSQSSDTTPNVDSDDVSISSKVDDDDASKLLDAYHAKKAEDEDHSEEVGPAEEKTEEAVDIKPDEGKEVNEEVDKEVNEEVDKEDVDEKVYEEVGKEKVDEKVNAEGNQDVDKEGEKEGETDDEKEVDRENAETLDEEKSVDGKVMQPEEEESEEADGGAIGENTEKQQHILEEKKAEECQPKPPLQMWRNVISKDEGSKFGPEAGRYHLYSSFACPWSQRALVVRSLKGLHDAISVTFCHPIWQATKSEDVYDKHTGWVFGDPAGEPFYNTAGLGGPFPASYPGTDPDTVNNCYSIREIYEKMNDTSGKYTLPIMWDKKLNTIVSNESSDIMRMLNSEFNEFATNPQLDLYPEELQQKIDYVNAWVYPTFNNGVYRCGFSTTQAVYDNAIDVLTKSFDHINEILKKQKFLVGNQITEADIRLFVTLVRFDEVYAVYFKTNTRCVIMAPAILDFCRRIYQMEGVAETCDMDQIKAHYFCSHAELNKFSVIPRGPGVLDFFSIPLSNKLRYPNL